MANLALEADEEIILQAIDVERYTSKRDEDYINIDEMYLTNQNLILTYEKSNGFFAKSEEVIEKIPLSDIRIANGKIQIFRRNNSDYGLGLQIVYRNGSHDHFVFDNRSELPIWYNSIIGTINGEDVPVVENIIDDEEESISGTKMIMNLAKSIINKGESDYRSNDAKITKKTVRTEKKKDDEKYCSNCGKIVKADSKFCNFCGASIGEIKNENIKIEEKIKHEEKNVSEPMDNKKPEEKKAKKAERKIVYEGEIHKCPNCGEVLKSFCINCPSCGFEIRNTNSANSVREFADKLAKIKNWEMPEFKESKSVMKSIFGSDFNNQDDLEEMQSNFERRKTEQEISFIINYSIPNSKEDMLEFMILATSNIDAKLVNDDLTKAWITKLDQVYKKAELTMKPDNPDFIKIKNVYDKKKKEIMKRKIFTIIVCTLPLYMVFFLLDTKLTIGLTALVICVIGILVYKNYKEKNKRRE